MTAAARTDDDRQVGAPDPRTPAERFLAPLLGSGRRGLPSTPTTVRVVVLGAAAVSWLVLVLRQLPCRVLPGEPGADRYQAMCYSDIPLLYRSRGLIDGYTPYLEAGPHPVLEYPVLTGLLMELERRIAVLLGAPLGPGLDSDQALVAADRFMAVNVIVLGLLFGVVVAAQLGTVVGRPRDALMVALSPCVMAAGLINWDLLAVALASLALLCWSRSRPGWAGALIGLATAAKLYPVLLLGPLVLLCWRAGRRREAATTVLAALGAWALVNVPVMLLAFDGWRGFWAFNAERGAEFGSFWYVLALAGYQIPALTTVSSVLLVVLCGGIGVLILFAPRRPRVGQVAYLVVLAFLLTSKVYSPQYVLWLLPLLVLARPRWREWLVFTLGELVYFAAIWLHLGGWLGPGDGGPDLAYWVAVLVRMGAELWVAAVVVRDIWCPRHDPVRTPGVDDPAGGVLDGAPDWPRPASAHPLRTHRTIAHTGTPEGEGVPIEQVIARIRAGGRHDDD